MGPIGFTATTTSRCHSESPSPWDPHPGKDVQLMAHTTSVSDFQRMMDDEHGDGLDDA